MNGAASRLETDVFLLAPQGLLAHLVIIIGIIETLLRHLLHTHARAAHFRTISYGGKRGRRGATIDIMMAGRADMLAFRGLHKLAACAASYMRRSQAAPANNARARISAKSLRHACTSASLSLPPLFPRAPPHNSPISCLFTTTAPLCLAHLPSPLTRTKAGASAQEYRVAHEERA